MVFYSCEKCGKQFSQKGHYNKHTNKNYLVLMKQNLKKL